MTNKEKYRLLCDSEKNIPVYSQPWWLDAVCGEDKWNVLLIENNGIIEASMPVYMPCRKVITMPPYAQTLGIWFYPDFKDKKPNREQSRKQQLCKQIIDMLPEHHFFLQNFHHFFTDWLQFYWNGYKQTTRYTYILKNISDTDELKSNFNEQIKRNIGKAIKHNVIVKRDVAVEDFIAIHEQTFSRQGLKPYASNTLREVVRVARNRKQGDIWGAFDDNGTLHAAAFIVWTKECAYYIAGGRNNSLEDVGAISFVMWEVLQFVSAFSTSFDFEGSMIEGVENFFRGFGAVQTPYFVISKGKLGIFQRALIKYNNRKKYK